MTQLSAIAHLPGQAGGPLLQSSIGLSFMGGVDAASGRVIDTHHPLHGQSVAGKILALPSGRGSCAGSLVLFELLMNDHAPAALVFSHSEPILTLGVLIAAELFGRGIPVLQLTEADFARLASWPGAAITGATVSPSVEVVPPQAPLPTLDTHYFDLTPRDRALLDGAEGEAARLAMRIILHVTRIMGARSLVDVDMAHIDGCFYQGPAGVRLARRLVDLGARVRIPSTMNALCVDRRTWREEGVDEAIGLPSDELAEAYVAMGVAPSYTCAPYLLEAVPKAGQRIAWGESNAVVFANSVLGARTLKYPDYLDILVALTGRAPASDCYLDAPRQARLRVDVTPPPAQCDAFFPALGYLVGQMAANEIPILCGLERLAITHDDLKAFGAAFATTSAAAMFHVRGHTPEAAAQVLDTLPRHSIGPREMAATWDELNTATTPWVDLISLGNPHFSMTEIEALARLCRGRRKREEVAMVVTCGREVMAKAEAHGWAAEIRAFGGRFLNDTCWCLIGAPIVSGQMRAIATNSGKYAHYGPAAVGKPFHFASLAACVEGAVTGRMPKSRPAWAIAA